MLNVLKHAGIVEGAVDRQPTAWLDMPSGDCFCFAEDDGMIETMVDLGEQVRRVRLSPASTLSADRRCATGDHAKMSGLLVARHFPGLVKAGDCASVIAVVVE